jgi:glycosyltransferase involved in cell wall biosynthesis
MLESELPFYGLGMPEVVKRGLGRMLDRLIPRRATHVLTVNDDIRNALIASKAVLPDSATTVPNGVEFAHFSGAVRSTGGTARAGRLIFTGNLAPYQGIDLMLKAFAKVVRVLNHVELHIVTGDSFHPYVELARMLCVNERLRFFPDDFGSLPLHLANADVALNPRTRCDGVPQKLLNYMAAGRAIVSFAGSARHLEHGYSGWIVPDDDIDGFARGAVELLSNRELASKLGAAAASYVHEKLGWDRSAQVAENAYLAVLR